MIFEDKEITLKDGRIAILRSPSVDDAERLLDYIKKACGETNFLVRYPEEWDAVTVESEENWVKGRRDSQNLLSINCCIDGDIIGNCGINFNSDIKTSHRATVAIAILKEYWGMGIGSAMFCELIEVAQKRGVEIIELGFVEGNERAKHLYEKFGFHVVAEKPSAFKLKDGTYLSEFYMQKHLPKR